MEVKNLKHLFEQNRAWSERLHSEMPDFFTKLVSLQSPEYLWIGCSDSRVPANQVVDLAPGELFVHRNVANVVVHTDMNCLSVLQYAVDVLKVKHVIVCGHYGCGGVQAAMLDLRLGLVDNWIRHVRDVYLKHRGPLDAIQDEKKRWDTLCELNVIEQVDNVCETTIIQNAWDRGQELTVHGWVYGLSNGLLCDLNMAISRLPELHECYPVAVKHALTRTRS